MRKDLVDNLGDYIAQADPNSVYGILKPQQKDGIRAVHYSLVNGHDKGIFKAPTGYGKSLEQRALMEAFNAPTLVVTSRMNLVEQLKAEYLKRAPHIPTTTYYSRNKDLSGQVNITTYPSYLSGLDNGEISTEYPVVLYDEAHHLLSERRRQGVNRFTDAIQIGFTATPGFGKGHELIDVLPHTMYSMSIREAVEQDLAASFSVFLVKTDVDLLGVKIKGTGSGRDYDQKQLEKAVNTSKRNRGAVELYTNNFQGASGISFCVGIEHSQDVAQEFRNAGVNAEAVFGKQNPKDQQQILDAYRKGQIQMLCNDRLLIEGSDFPQASVIFNLRPTLSPVVAEQRGGRGLRVNPADQTKFTRIFDFIDEGKKPPISFAQVAEAAVIVNSWHQGMDIQADDPAMKRIYLAAEGFRVYTDSKEVMWALNMGFEDEVKTEEAKDSKQWKSLRRISAESSVPLEALQKLAQLRKVQISDYRHSRSFRGPHRDPSLHYDAAGALVLMMSAIGTFGYETDFSIDVPEDQDPDFPFIKRESLEQTNYNSHYIAELKRLQEIMGGAQEAIVAEYTKQLHIEITRNPDLYGDL